MEQPWSSLATRAAHPETQTVCWEREGNSEPGNRRGSHKEAVQKHRKETGMHRIASLPWERDATATVERSGARGEECVHWLAVLAGMINTGRVAAPMTQERGVALHTVSRPSCGQWAVLYSYYKGSVKRYAQRRF